MKIKVKSLEKLKAMEEELDRYMEAYENSDPDNKLLKSERKRIEAMFKEIAGKTLDVKIRPLEYTQHFHIEEIAIQYDYDYLYVYKDYYIYPYQVEWHEFMTTIK